MTKQFYHGGRTVVAFIDHGEALRSSKCQPRDIELLSDVDDPRGTIHEIVVDTRIAQGYPKVGVAKNMIWGV